VIATVEHGERFPAKYGHGDHPIFLMAEAFMQLTYDPEHNIAYIRLREKTGEVETIRISDEVNIDLAADGHVYGIELLNANAQLTQTDAGKLLIVNEASGEHREIPLVAAF
jgi:uncharacterized protein YuzE